MRLPGVCHPSIWDADSMHKCDAPFGYVPRAENLIVETLWVDHGNRDATPHDSHGVDGVSIYEWYARLCSQYRVHQASCAKQCSAVSS